MFRLGTELLDTSHFLVHAAAAAYEKDPTNYAHWSDFGIDRFNTFPMHEFSVDDEIGATNGFVASNEKHMIIAFRGTDDVFDIAMNLSASQNPNLEYYEGSVHRGFATALNKIWVDLSSLIEDLRRPDQTVWITGHSMGGALATLTAKRLAQFMSPVRCITFGQPRVGNPIFYQNYKVTHHRFVNQHDMIPMLPPRGIFTRYWHVGEEHKMNGDGELTSGEGDTSLLEDVFFGRLASLLDLSSHRNESLLDELIKKGMFDHRIDTYIDRIAKLATRPADN